MDACIHVYARMCVRALCINVYNLCAYAFIFLRQIEASHETGLYTVVSAADVNCSFPTSINCNLIGHAMLNLPGYLL